MNSKCCGESAPAATAHLCNNQYVVSMRQKCFQCVAIKFLNRKHVLIYQEKKNTKLLYFFWMLLHGNMITAAPKHADSLNLGSYTRKKHLTWRNSSTVLYLPSKLLIKSPIASDRDINCNVTNGAPDVICKLLKNHIVNRYRFFIFSANLRQHQCGN